MPRHYNLARMLSDTVGSAAVVSLTAAAPGFLTFASAGVPDGQRITYAIEEGTSREIGHGTYSSGVITAGTVLRSTNGGSHIVLAGAAQVFIDAAAEDILPPINELDAIATLALGDIFAVWDASGSATGRASYGDIFKHVDQLPAVGSVGLTDKLPLRDESLTSAGYATVLELFGTINQMTAAGTPALTDKLPIYLASTAAARSITPQAFFNLIDQLVAAGTPALTDKIPLYMASGATTRTFTIGDIFKAVNLLTESTSPSSDSDYVPIYNASTAAARKVKPQNLVPKADASSVRAWVNGGESITPAALASAVTEVSLTDGASVAWNMAAGIDFALTLGGNRVMQVPSPVVVGKKGRLRVIQGGGNNTITWASVFKFDASTAFALSSAAGAQDLLYYDAIGSAFIALMQGSKGVG